MKSLLILLAVLSSYSVFAATTTVECSVDEVSVFQQRLHAHCGSTYYCAGSNGKSYCTSGTAGVGAISYFAVPVTDPRAGLFLQILSCVQAQKKLVTATASQMLVAWQAGLTDLG